MLTCLSSNILSLMLQTAVLPAQEREVDVVSNTIANAASLDLEIAIL